MKDRMLITGGCGFIGSHFTDFQMGYVDMEVIVVDKLTYASNIDYLPDGAKLIKKDINDVLIREIKCVKQNSCWYFSPSIDTSKNVIFCIKLKI